MCGGGGGGGSDSLEGEEPQRRPQKRLDRPSEEVSKAVGGGYCRLQMPLRLALGVRGTVAGHGLGALRGGGGGAGAPPSLPMHPLGRGGGHGVRVSHAPPPPPASLSCCLGHNMSKHDGVDAPLAKPSAGPAHSVPSIVAAVALYVSTGIVQPLMVDFLKYEGFMGGTDPAVPSTHMGVLLNTLGMAAVGAAYLARHPLPTLSWRQYRAVAVVCACAVPLEWTHPGHRLLSPGDVCWNGRERPPRISGTADPRSSQTRQVVQGLR